MRYLVFFLVLWVSPHLAYTQKRTLHIDSIQRFYFLDYHTDFFGYYHHIDYEVVKEKGVWKQYVLSRKIQENDDLIPVRRRRLGKKLPKLPKPPKDISKRRFIANMPVDTLQRFITLFNQTRPNEPCTLEDFGINQTWINKTAPAFYEEILKNDRKRVEYEANKDKIMAFISSEKYYYEHLIENAYFHTDDYPTSAIRIDFTDGDTLHLVTHSQQKRMPIWSVFRRVAEQHTTKNSICSPAISQWLGHQILSNNGVSYQEQEADFFAVITEKNGARSFWAWEAGKRLILWKYDENSAFAALDTAGKARKRFPTDTEHVLLKPID